MKIMLVNKFHWYKGGSEKYYFELGELLKKHGHQVAYFSMEDEKNIATGDKEYFVKKSDLNSKNITKALSVIYSNNNKKEMEKALDDFKPDIVHLNNFQRQLSASIIDPCIDRNIPIVFTAHDMQAICPSITMLDPNKNPCELCIKGKYLNCIKNKCIKNSYLKSILGAIENSYYRKHKIYQNKIDYIITPSNFLKNKLVKDGIDSEKIKAIPNFIDIEDYNINISDDGYALYFGRLSREKGIINLIKAFSKIDNGTLYIAGEGPEEDTIKDLIKTNKIENRVKVLGFLNKQQMKEVISKCKFVIVPSICNENCPYSAIESIAMGKPVIGSNKGGIPELVINNKNGYIYDYDNIDELSEKMQKLFKDKKLSNDFSKEAKALAKNKYSQEKYYKELINLYNELKKKNEKQKN